MSAPTISLRDVRREYRLGSGTVHAVRGVSFDIGEGEWAAVVGPSGCGKSTLLHLLGAIDRPTAGTVRLRDRDVGAMSDKEATGFRLRHVGFVFQRFYLMPTLGARENVELPMAEAGVGTQVHYIPLHRQPYFHARYGAQSLPGAEAWYARALTLPLFPAMADEDVDRAVESLRAALG